MQLPWRDPALGSLRVATRAAIVQPVVLAFAILVLRQPQATLFAAFAVFGLLVLGNFGGAPASRALAYLVATVSGCVLVALGTIASPLPLTAALLTGAVVFGLELLAVYGGQVAAARPPLMMATVLAASVPAPIPDIPERMLGWAIGGAAAALAASLLWPRHESGEFRSAAARGLRALADALALDRTGSLTEGEAAVQARAAVASLRGAYVGTGFRTAGTSRQDRALAQLVSDLERGLELVLPAAGVAAGENPCLAEGRALAEAVVAILCAAAEVLEGGASPPLLKLEQARVAHRLALDDWAAARLRAGDSADRVLQGLDFDHRLRVLSYIALAIGLNATTVAGRDPDLSGVRVPLGAGQGGGTTWRRLLEPLLTHLSWSSPVLQGALRAALGLGAAVLVARVFDLSRAFWVVLGTMSVLRTSALATGRTSLQAMVGTLVGFAVAGVFTLAFAHDRAVMWAALPIAVFLAAYAPSVLSFATGQGAFTILMIVLFNLLNPVGWRVGLVRIEDLAVGSVIGVGVGLLLWPRGARSAFARALALFYRQVAVYLAEAIYVALGKASGESLRARDDARAARERTGEAFAQLQREGGDKHLSTDLAAVLMSAADQVLIVGDTLEVLADMGYTAAGCSEGTHVTRAQGAALVASWFMLSERIENVRAAHVVPLARDDLTAAALSCLDIWRGGDAAHGRSAVATAWLREWLLNLDTRARELEQPAQQLAAAAAIPWWR